MSKREICIKELKWNRMWTLWKNYQTKSPLTELLTYENAMQIGGHLKYFKETNDNEIYFLKLENEGINIKATKSSSRFILFWSK